MSNRSGRFMPTQQEPDIQIIKLHKSNNGMGLSIVAAKVSCFRNFYLIFSPANLNCQSSPNIFLFLSQCRDRVAGSLGKVREFNIFSRSELI